MHLEGSYALPGFEQDSYEQTMEQILLKQTERARRHQNRIHRSSTV